MSDPTFETVKNASPENKLSAFRSYCESIIAKHNAGELTVQEASYNICGTGFQVLEVNGERQVIVSEILDQACDLELPPEHRNATSNWDTLVALVRKL